MEVFMLRVLRFVLTVEILFSSSLGLTQSIITTYAGGGPSGGPALQAALTNVQGLAVKDSGDVMIAAQKIFKVDVAGTLSVLQDVAATGLALDNQNGLLFDDESQNLIRRMDLVTGQITTLAGNGGRGYSGDNGPASAASIDLSYTAFAIDAVRNVFFVDGQGMRVRRIDGTSGIITTVVSLTNIIGGETGIGGLATPATDDLFLSTNTCTYDPENICFPFYGLVFHVVAGGTLVRIAGSGNTFD